MNRARWLTLLNWCLVIAFVHVAQASESCPSLCACKWKNGKRTVECTERGLIKIPENADPETQVLDMSVNNLQILPKETFSRSGLINLQRVYLRSCRLGQIDNEAFKGVTNLIELDLSGNLLTSVPSKTFSDTPFLRDLIISNNPIQKINAAAFKNLRSLMKLDISNCEIKMVAPKAFEGVESLESLKINDNQLSELRPHTVEVLTRLHGVELHNNPWHCDCRLRVIKEWLIQYNIAYAIPPKCSGGPDRLIQKSFSDLHIDDLACKPDILPANRYLEATAGDNATLTCRANAIPPAQIKWFWNGKLLTNNSHFGNQHRITVSETGRQEKRSLMTVSNVQEIDYMEFYCVAENRAGSSETNYTLRVVPRPMGITSLGNGQIVCLSAGLAMLALLVIITMCVLLFRMRRSPYIDTKTPRQLEVVTVVNGSALPNGKAATVGGSSASNGNTLRMDRKQPSDLNLCNPIQKPPRINDQQPYATNSYTGYNCGNGSVLLDSSYISPSSNSGNNPDLINDMRPSDSTDMVSSHGATVLMEDCDSLGRPCSGEYSRNADSLYPSSLWEGGDESSYHVQRVVAGSNPGFVFDDKTTTTSSVSMEMPLDDRTIMAGYPQDYGLPLATTEMTASATQVSLPTSTKTLRVWQKGAVPVLPPVTALKRALGGSSRNSPDEGYQEGCGTDV